MRRVEFELEGICPILFSRFHEAEQSRVKAQKRTRLTEKDRMEEVDLKCYKTKSGELFIPAEQVKASIINATGELAQRMKKTEEKQLYKSSIFIEPEELGLGKKKWDFIDERRVVNPNTRGAQMCKRPAMDTGWKIKGKMILVDDLITIPSLHDRMKLAGLRYGLGSFRPNFGRFIVTKLKEVK